MSPKYPVRRALVSMRASLVIAGLFAVVGLYSPSHNAANEVILSPAALPATLAGVMDEMGPLSTAARSVATPDESNYRAIGGDPRSGSWSDNFDDGNLNGWTIQIPDPAHPGDGPVTIQASTEQSVSGAYSLKVSGPSQNYYSGVATGPNLSWIDWGNPFTIEFWFRYEAVHWYYPMVVGPVKLTIDRPDLGLVCWTDNGVYGSVGPPFQSYCPANTWVHFLIRVYPSVNSYYVHTNGSFRLSVHYTPGFDSDAQGFRIIETGGLAPSEPDYVQNAYYDDLKITDLVDCNQNGIPDLCDINCSALGGACNVPGCGQSEDCNNNLIPDECEYDDCNANGVPDDCDINPSDPDGNGSVSPDCNINGVPDECEYNDCNANGIPDDCDVDPLDPDGNGQVSPDCNANGVPDECDDDCNANGVPDDCDVDPLDPDGNGQVSPDCNTNVIPDECDVDPSDPDGNGLVSEDCNADVIPDECQPLEFSMPPKSVTCIEGESVTLTVQVQGPEPLFQQWRKNGVPIVGATGLSLLLNTTTLADTGRYDVVLTACSGEITSRSAWITVLSNRLTWPQWPGTYSGPEVDFDGSNTYSKYTKREIAADDWTATDGQPVAEIVWWGSYLKDPYASALAHDWVADVPPDNAPTSFHLAIWTDVPTGVDQPWSHPGSVVREWIVPRASLNEHKVGLDGGPANPESCFLYHFVIPQAEWFQPLPGHIYWFSIAAIYSCPCLADMNMDGMVSAVDLSAFVACTHGAPTPLCEYADTDCDGDVDGANQTRFACQRNNPPNPLVCCPNGGYWPPQNTWGWTTRRPSWHDAAIRIIQPTGPVFGSNFIEGQPLGSTDLAFVLFGPTAPQTQACCVVSGPCTDGLLPWQCVRGQGGVPAGTGFTCATAPPSITQQPVSQTACIGSSASFTVTATGAATLTYQWEKGGQPIPGARSATLVLIPVNPTDAGAYAARVTNSCGTILSQTATLVVFATGTADVNGDGVANGADISMFAGQLLNPTPGTAAYCAADLDGDHDVDTNDTPLFVSALLTAQ